MFGRKKPHAPQKQIDSLIGASTTVQGDVNFSGGLRVDGHVRGHIHSTGDSPATLVISEKAVVDGEIRVSHVVVDGSVNGPIYASEYLELLPNAKVVGDLNYKTLEMQVGATVDGRLLHLPSDSAEIVEIKRLAGNTATG
ncbi:MAG: polymer-forming cytoskeletal protein [Burkholderiales bacterium]|nr:MAG: polymer-forming cytoskeletal protein [Burkholderiales bacterium]TAG82510.1 MAG: polymer-forming cytoskeletal protein [Betaproteobacteria bacterium]